MPSSFELNRQAVLGGGKVPGLSTGGQTPSGSLFEQNRNAVLSQKPTSTPTSTPTVSQPVKPIAPANIFDTAKTAIGNTFKSITDIFGPGKPVANPLPNGYKVDLVLSSGKVPGYNPQTQDRAKISEMTPMDKIKTIAKSPQELFLPTSSNPVGKAFRQYVSDTIKIGTATAKSLFNLTPMGSTINNLKKESINNQYKVKPAAPGKVNGFNPETQNKVVSLETPIQSATGVVLGGLNLAYRMSIAGPLLGAAFGSLKSSRESATKLLKGEPISPTETIGRSVSGAFSGINEQPGLGAVITDNPVAQAIIDVGFMAVMVSKPFIGKKLDTVKLKANEMTKVADTLGVKPSASMGEIATAYKNKIVEFKDVFAGKGTTEEIAQVKKLNEAYNILKKSGVWERRLAGLFGKVNVDDIKPVTAQPKAISEKSGTFIQSGEYTPAEIRGKIIDTPIENTVEGKAIIRASLVAEQNGQNIKITSPEDLKNFNKVQSEKNTQKVVTETLAGNREDKRLNTKQNIEIASTRLGFDTATPDANITVYRAGTGEIKPGDHVTTEEGAKAYLDQRDGSQLLKKTVVLKDLVFSEGIKSEFIYSPKTIDKGVISEEKGIDILKTEVKKYDTPEKFIESIGNNDNVDLEDVVQFHGTQNGAELRKAITEGTVRPTTEGLMGRGFYTTTSNELGDYFGKQVSTTGTGGNRTGVSTKPDVIAIDLSGLKIKRQDFGKGEYYDFLDKEGLSANDYNLKLQKEGYDGLNLVGRGETVIFDPKNVKTIDLTDFYNKNQPKLPQKTTTTSPNPLETTKTQISTDNTGQTTISGGKISDTEKSRLNQQKIAESESVIAKKYRQEFFDKGVLSGTPLGGAIPTPMEDFINSPAGNKENIKLVKEAIEFGDLEAAKQLHQDFKLTEDFNDLETQVYDQQKKEFEAVNKEIGLLDGSLPEGSPDRALIDIATKIGKHFNAPQALFKITGQSRVYSTPDGTKITVGGNKAASLDRLFFASDLEGFSKTVKVLAYKFDKTFSEINSRIDSGDIDGADYESFKKKFYEITDKRPTYSTGSSPIAKTGTTKGKIKPTGNKTNETVSNKPSNVKEKQTSDYGFNPKNLEEPASPKATAEVKKIIKQSEIAKNLNEKLGIPIRRGLFRHAGAIGLYKGGPKVARIKSGGLQTVFHEAAGHFLDDMFNFSQDISVSEREALMSEYGNKYENQPTKQKAEAFAEFMRFYLTGQDAKITEYAPKFKEFFDDTIKQMPDVQAILEESRRDYKRWQDQPATAKILSHLSIGSQNEGTLKSRVVSTLHDLYTVALDDLHPLGEFSKLAESKVGKLPAKIDPYILARNLRGWVGKADLFLNEGTFGKTFWKKNTKGKTVIDFKGKGYTEIMKPIVDAKQLDEFRVYLVAKRIVVDLADRKIVTGISVDDAKTAVAELEAKHPNFIKVAEERLKFKDEVLQYGMENGVIGPKGYAKIKDLNKFHVPFYRVMEESQNGFLGKSKIAGNINSPIKKIKGSEREIIDPLESDVKDVYAIINAAERNNIGIAMANLSVKDFELGRLFEEVPKPMMPVTLNTLEVMKKAFKDTDVTVEDLPLDQMEEMITMFKTTYASGPNMLNVNFGDEQKVFQVDPDLFKTIQGLNGEDMGILMKIMSMPAKLLRAGATLTPDFSVRNPIRDQFSAMVYSQYGFRPGIDLAHGMFELMGNTDVYKLWKAGGGEHAMTVSLDRTNIQNTFKELMASKGTKLAGYVRSPIKFLQIISEFGEIGTRLGEMRQALRSGADPIASAFASREVTLDFARIGAKTKAMNAITAFWNANLQGTDKMIRSFKTRPFQTLFKTLLGITLPSILLYMANRKDPRWKEIPAWQKNLFWIVMTDKHIWRIPKPFELGIIFGSVPERVLEFMDEKDPMVFNELEKSIVSGFTPGFLPTSLIPIIENITNYSFFADRPIVSRGQEGLPPEAQAGTYTSEVAKIIGETLKYSPSKIDNLIQGYTGGLGKYAVNITDKILEGTNVVVVPKAPANNFEDIPVLKAFMIRKPIGTGSESVNRVYDMYASTSSQLNYVKLLVKLKDIGRAKDFISKHPEIVYATQLNTLVSTFSDINKGITEIRNNKTMDPNTKRDKINQLGELETTLSQKFLEIVKNKNK